MTYIPDSLFEDLEQLKSEGKFEEALKIVNKLLVNDTTNEKILLQVADIEYMKGDISRAEKPVDFILKYKRKSDPMGYYVKGVLEMEKTNWKEAKSYLKKALEIINFENPEILRCYGLCEYWSGNREKGIDFLLKVFEMNNNDAEIIYNLIELSLLEHRYYDAKTYIKHYHDNYQRLETFGKDIGYYDSKIRLFEDYLATIKNKKFNK